MQIKGWSLSLVILAGLALAGCGAEATPDAAEGTVNAPPLVAGTPATQLTVGTAYSFTPTASDPDGDTLSFSAEGLPTWLQIDKTTGRIWGTPAMANVGTTGDITIDVFDQKAHTEFGPFRLTVINPDAPPVPPVNTAPTIAGTPGTSATVGTAYTFTPTADDAQDDALTFEITNKPSWATFTPATGQLRGTPRGIPGAGRDTGARTGPGVKLWAGVGSGNVNGAMKISRVNWNRTLLMSRTRRRTRDGAPARHDPRPGANSAT